MDYLDELLKFEGRLKNIIESFNSSNIYIQIDEILTRAREVGLSFSGSWFGYHAQVYYNGFITPPPYAIFSIEWGLMHTYSTNLGSSGDWVIYTAKEVKDFILHGVDENFLTNVNNIYNYCIDEFEFIKNEFKSILITILEKNNDSFLLEKLDKLDKLSILTKNDIIFRLSPKGALIIRDTKALSQGKKIPPHIDIIAELEKAKLAYQTCNELSKEIDYVCTHIKRKKVEKGDQNIMTGNVFIGHGRSPLWRELKDFIKDRLSLPYDEFNRVPIAGVPTSLRLAQMLDNACIAFLIMTGEDETSDGNLQARMNVIHEAGLFQGRLGFEKAIILLEEGCQEFSNIIGLGQIRFPKGNISACFEDVRLILEREGVIKSL